MHAFPQWHVENILWLGIKAVRRISVGPKSHLSHQTAAQGLLQSLTGLCKSSLIWLAFRYMGPPIKSDMYNYIYVAPGPTMRSMGVLACWNVWILILICKNINVSVSFSWKTVLAVFPGDLRCFCLFVCLFVCLFLM